jgi:hypothetical protein
MNLVGQSNKTEDSPSVETRFTTYVQEFDRVLAREFSNAAALQPVQGSLAGAGVGGGETHQLSLTSAMAASTAVQSAPLVGSIASAGITAISNKVIGNQIEKARKTIDNLLLPDERNPFRQTVRASIGTHITEWRRNSKKPEEFFRKGGTSLLKHFQPFKKSQYAVSQPDIAGLAEQDVGRLVKKLCTNNPGWDAKPLSDKCAIAVETLVNQINNSRTTSNPIIYDRSLVAEPRNLERELNDLEHRWDRLTRALVRKGIMRQASVDELAHLAPRGRGSTIPDPHELAEGALNATSDKDIATLGEKITNYLNHFEDKERTLLLYALGSLAKNEQTPKQTLQLINTKLSSMTGESSLSAEDQEILNISVRHLAVRELIKNGNNPGSPSLAGAHLKDILASRRSHENHAGVRQRR